MKTVSDRIDEYIEEAVGGVDDRTHRIFKDVVLNAGLWILQSIQSHDLLLASLCTEITTNERNSRAATKSLEAALDSYGLKDVNLTPKAVEHCQVLDKQELERQKALEEMIERLERENKGKMEAMTKEKSRSDYGDDITKNGESRKRKRDIETEDHMDIDILM
ncbi:unnamed protein product [Aureobasidium vineae]|uniref:Uncharacterized protein n=1 Tax=Aureobasidium vineae TaxID=2773715 RepID=A0A9N8JX21_9PEZI|nr:unnamed protein product [Aureobasidium vineae]